MDIELIDRAWRVLPKEFKEEVKKEYLDHHESGDMKFSYGYSDVLTDGYSDALTDFFGEHNLTSDAEEEEMLTVPRKKVQRAYNTSREIVKAENPDSLMYSMHTQIMCVLENIFGSKCLPDAHEDNFTTKEPQPAEPKNDGTSQKQYVPQNAESGTHSFNHILKDDFRDYNRLHIAAMAMQGILANSHQEMVDMKIDKVAELAIEAADALIAECKKGGDNA